MLHRGQQLRRGGRSRGAQIGDEIGDGEVGLVSHSGDHGNFRSRNCPREEFGVERRKVLGGAAAARDDDRIDIHRTIEMKNAGSDFARRLLALHGGGIEQHIQAGVPPLGDVKKIVNDRTGERCDDTDTARKRRKSALARGVEQSFLLRAFASAVQRRVAANRRRPARAFRR